MQKKMFFAGALSVALAFLLTACAAKQEPVEPDESVARLSDSAEVQMQNQVHEAGQASYEPYSPERLEELKGNRPFALFFYSQWDPLCRNLEAQLIGDLEDLGRAAILKADFDTALDLRQEYGVSAQTTVVFFDASGEVQGKKLKASVKDVQDFFVGNSQN